jgi:hypothetical protein
MLSNWRLSEGFLLVVCNVDLRGGAQAGGAGLLGLLRCMSVAR